VKFAGVAGAVLAVALVWHFGSQRLQAYVNTTHARPVTTQDIRFSEEPTLMSVAEINLLRADLAATIGPEPMNREGLRAAADLLRSRRDVVRELRQVRRLPDGTVDVDLSFRTPAAIVQMRNEHTGAMSPDGYHVIDDRGFQMYGPLSLVELSHLELPQILGVNSKYRPKDDLGEYRWQGPEVDAALALIAELDGTALDFIDSISVNNTDERGRLRLVMTVLVRPTANSRPVACNIIWGLPPGQERSIEPDADRKLAALTALLGDDRFRHGHWQEVWINTGDVRPRQAIGGEGSRE
ncbi:MAG: hypothetical protein AAF961_11725, partial [Planctomycetota bacterium]